MRRDLERVGQQTGKILADAHDAGEELRAEAEGEAHRIAEEVSTRASQTRTEADAYSATTREGADAYSAKVHGLRPSSARTLGYYEVNDVYLA